MRIYVKGFGCSSSLADAEVIAGCLANAGHTIARNVQDAELVLYNTCAVKTPTENRMMNLLRKVPKEKKLIIAGCLPLINFERLAEEIRFDGVVGPALGEEIVNAVSQVARGMHVTELKGAEMAMPRLDLPRVRVNPEISVIPISYGCLGSCSYCCVRFARGSLRSYKIEEIVNKVNSDLEEGVHEFWLTSQDTACYGRDIGTNLARLLASVCGLEGDFFVRVGMMTPNSMLDILDELVETFKDEKVFKFLHLPIQSGDDDVLGLMRRSYTVKDFVTIVEKFRKVFPQLTFATDVIVGFPGENDQAFNNTMNFIGEVKPDVVNVSKFFARPKTLAAGLKPQISPREIKRRSACLAKLTRRITFERNHAWEGWSGRVLVDELGKRGSVVGRNFAYKPIVIKNGYSGNLLGRFVSVKVVDMFQSYLLGELCGVSLKIL